MSPDNLEQGVQQHAKALQQAMHATAQTQSGQWLNTLLQRINRDECFRIAALRFIDVLPALEDDEDLIKIYREYFVDIDFPVPIVGRALKGVGDHLPHALFSRAIRKASQLLAQQFMGGENATQVAETLDGLTRQGLRVSLDMLGEASLSEREADAYAEGYISLLHSLPPDQPLHLSVKLSSLYPRMAPHNVDGSIAGILPRLCRLLEQARAHNAAVTFDMEDYDKRHLIMSIYRKVLLDARFHDWPGLGIAVQSYLRESTSDIRELIALAHQREIPFSVRLVRGAYWDQETILAKQHGWPIPVWQQQMQTDRQYEQNLLLLMQAAPWLRTEVATHNPRSMAFALAVADALGQTGDQYEFQMLYGMMPAMQQALLSLRQPLRVYVPFGRAVPGMAYLIRRLLENASSQSLERLQGGEGEAERLDFTPPGNVSEVPREQDPGASRPGFRNQPVHRFTGEAERREYQGAIDKLAREPTRDTALLLDGRWVDGDRQLESFNPAHPDQRLGSVSVASQSQLEHAVQAARSAWPGWASLEAAERANLIRRAADELTARRDEFAALEIFEAGKNWIEADADVCEAIDFLRFYADEAERLATGETIGLPGEDNHHVFRPHGIGVVIAPWNFPLAILVGMLSATLVSGNCALLKPSSDTPLVAARFVELLHGLGLPSGVLAFVPGAGEMVGEYLVTHPDVHVVAFTGSLSVGQKILAHSARLPERQTHFKQVIAELGGKNAVIVDSSADPDQAIAGIVQSAFGFSGQKCSACSRVIVVGGQYRAFTQRLVDATASLKIGDPAHPDCDVGPVINAAAVRRIQTAIENGHRQGKLLYQADLDSQSEGHYVGPTVFGDVDPRGPLAQHEIFGPVLSIMRARDFAHALEIANDTPYGLTGGVYSRSPANLQRAREQFQVGNLYLNRGITGALVARQPFGGYRLSGTGSKAGGRDYLVRFMRSQCVTENTMRQGVAPLD